jgi:hypothetical protein
MNKCICIGIPKDWPGSDKIEVGKIYTYFQVTRPKLKDKYVIVNEDDGKLMTIQNHWFYTYFQSIEERRNEFINSILE